jgi:hypothetical protein
MRIERRNFAHLQYFNHSKHKNTTFKEAANMPEKVEISVKPEVKISIF